MNTIVRSFSRGCAYTVLLAAPFVTAQPTANPDEARKLERFEVTGSLIKRTDFEGPSPLRVITRDEIDVAGALGLSDVLREIPEATLMEINEGSTVGAARGTSALDLRNLGPSNTLILVDGRRQAPNGISVSGTVFVDPNRFPAAMIERVEVLKDGASAVYGADATAGVVNIITRKDFTGAEISARYGNYFKTDGGEQTYSFSAGIARGRLRFFASATWATRNANAAIDEPFSANADLTDRFRALDPVKYAPYLVPTATARSNFDYRSLTGPFATVYVPSTSLAAATGYPAAALVNPLTGRAATFLPGTGGVTAGTLGTASNPASIPRGDNPARPLPEQFVARAYPAGVLSNSFNFQPYVWNVPETRRRGITTKFDFALTPFVSLYGAVSYQRNESTTHLAPTPLSSSFDLVLVPATNYYNPFGISVAFTYRPLEFGARVSDVTSKNLNLLAGVRGSWLGRFDWDVGFSSSENDMRDVSVNSLSRRALRAALAKTTPDALNIFGGPTFHNDPTTLASIRIAPATSGDSRTQVADAHLSTAELLTLPWGKLGGAASAEHREESYNVTNDPLSSVENDIAAASPGDNPTRSHRQVDSFAAELRAPLVPENRWRGLHTLELSTAARVEKFSDGFTSGVQPFAGFRYRPTRDLLVRGSYGKVFRAPSLPQLYGGTVNNQLTGLADLRRPQGLTNDIDDGSTAVRLVQSGGNPKLLPENGRTKQIGAVYDVSHGWLRGLALDFTHGVIQQMDLITGALGTTYIRQNELGTTADLVIREPGAQTFTNNTTAAISVLSGPDNQRTLLQPGQSTSVPGHIVMIRDAAINLADQIVRYDDYGITYRFGTTSLGRFVFSSSWTYYEFYARRRFTTDPYLNRIGRGRFRYRGQSSVTWQRGPWGANLGMNYFHRLGNIDLDQVETQRYYTFNAGLSYAFRRHALFGDTRIALGIENLFGRTPSLYPSTMGYDQSLIARPGGRFAFLSVRRSL